VKISVSDFNSTFSAMKKLKPITKADRGLVAVLLPNTVGAVGADPYIRLDAPCLKRAFSTADLPSSLLIVQNARGSAATQLADAQADVVQGASVLILDPTDPGAALLAQGYDEVMAPYFKSGKWTDVANPPGTWAPNVALSEFERQYKAHPGINAALTPDDSIGGPIISYLNHKGIKAKAFPLTGRQATVPGLRNIVAQLCPGPYAAACKAAGITR
jgi:ABC-type xylose transport system substrate-binding protein